VKLYKIHDWERNFENNRTREVETLTWLRVPVKHDGDGFRAVIHHEDGLKIFGAWVLLLQVAAKCKPRGVLVRQNGLPHTERTIARITGAQEGDIYIAMQYLASNEVAWLCGEDVDVPQSDGTSSAPDRQSVGSPPQAGAVKCAASSLLSSPLISSGPDKERKSTQQPCPAFDLFWKAWPAHKRKDDPKGCRALWKREGLDAHADEIMASLAAWKESAEWAKQDGEFIPGPKPWLNKRKWQAAHPAPADNTPDYDPDAPGMLFPKKSPEEIERLLAEVENG
jgi:hypothetical protein